MTVNREHIEMARALHEKHFVSDAHFDLLPLIWDRPPKGRDQGHGKSLHPCLQTGRRKFDGAYREADPTFDRFDSGLAPAV